MNEEKIHSEISHLLKNYLNSSGAPGAALAVMWQGKIICSMSEGAASLEKSIPMTTATLFGAGSISKTFTALAFLLLEREGFLSLDDPVSKYLPDVDQAVVFIGETVPKEKSPLLLRHLLSHSSGIPELGLVVSQFFRLCGVNTQGPYDLNDNKGLLPGASEAAKQRYLQPGEKFLYSNENYVLLAHIAELVTGQPFAEIIKTKILMPLGMTHSSIGYMESDPRNAVITGYVPALNPPLPVPLQIPVASYGPGGLVTTIDDLSKYLGFLLGSRQLAGEGISTYSKKLWKKVIPRNGSTGQFYGLGWYIQENDFSGPFIYHGGDILFSGGICAVLPEYGLGIVIGQNAGSTPILVDFTRDVFHLILGEEGLENRVSPPQSEMFSMNELSGVYTTYADVYTVEVYFRHGILILRVNIPGSESVSELPFAASSLSDSRAEFIAADFPIPPRRASCVFIRSESGEEIWLQYGDYLFRKNVSPENQPSVNP
ncbi:MAG: beta-lactamase family protein [Chloroflexi bacterium]|nr:beta-lactamase family protein [Chloroflexota bacterium]